MAELAQIEGIGSVFMEKLREAGIETSEALLERGATPEGRADLALQTGISPELILHWVNQADLVRIEGIGAEQAGLLEETGVDTIAELAQRSPERLHRRLLEVNEQRLESKQ